LKKAFNQLTRPQDALLCLLHLCDSLFPIGSFAYSDGLESAAASVGKPSTFSSSSGSSNWPPYTVSSASDIHVPATITGQINTITRADGTLQVTYNGLPLYFFANDKAVGDANGVYENWGSSRRLMGRGRLISSIDTLVIAPRTPAG